MPSRMLKAGGLDDPVWAEPVNAAPPPKRRLRNPRRSILVLGALSALLAVGLLLWLSGSKSNHAGGDPGGRILTELEPASAAVPAGSTNVVTHPYDSIWSPACPDNPAGQAGWSEVMVNTSFSTALSKVQVVGAVNSVLVRQGWARHDESFGPGQGVNAHWTKHLASGIVGEASVFASPAGSSNWFLGVTADPPGFALPGC